MKTAAELRYLQHPVGAQLLPYFAQRPEVRRNTPLINLPQLAHWFGRRNTRIDASRQHAASQT